MRGGAIYRANLKNLLFFYRRFRYRELIILVDPLSLAYAMINMHYNSYKFSSIRICRV